MIPYCRSSITVTKILYGFLTQMLYVFHFFCNSLHVRIHFACRCKKGTQHELSSSGFWFMPPVWHMGEKFSFICTLNIAHTRKIMVWVVFHTVWYLLSLLFFRVTHIFLWVSVVIADTPQKHVTSYNVTIHEY